MKAYQTKHIFFLLLLSYLCSCSDFIAPNLDKSKVVLISPSNGLITNHQNIQFSWDSLAGATSYQFQIVSPSYNQAYQLILDTILHTNALNLRLNNGTYQWRLTASNNSGNSQYSTWNLVVNNTSPIASFPVQPAYGQTIPSPVMLKWKRFKPVTSDSIFIYSDSTFSELKFNALATDTFISFYGMPGSYFWYLRSIDSIGNISKAGSYCKFVIH